jgi:hypothetical protein
MKKIVAALLGFVLLGGQGEARADHIVVTFSGEVGFVKDPSGGSFTQGVHPGSAFVATVTYDANASPLTTGGGTPPGSRWATYPTLSSSVRIGDRVFGSDLGYPPGAATLTVANFRNPYDGFDSLDVVRALDPALYEPGSNFRIGLSDRTGSAFPSLSLPTSLDSKRFDMNHGITDGYFEVNLKPAGSDLAGYARVSGLVNSFDTVSVPTAQAPEPSAIVLLATGGVGLLGIARRRRSCSGSSPTRQ